MIDADELVVFSTTWCSDCVATKRALDARAIPYREIDVDQDASAEAFVLSVNGGRRSVPTLAMHGRVANLSRFSPRKFDEALQHLGVSRRASHEVHDRRP